MEIYKLYDKAEGFIKDISEYILEVFSERNITEYEVESVDFSRICLFSKPREKGFDIKLGPFKKIVKIQINICSEYVVNPELFTKIYDDEGGIWSLRDLSLDDLIHVANLVCDYESDKRITSDFKSTGKVLHFENEDIIITDPSYIMKQSNQDYLYEVCPYNYDDYNLIKLNHWDCRNLTISQLQTAYLKKKEYDNLERDWQIVHRTKLSSDWDKCNCGRNMEIFGFTQYLTRSTIYGDWSCTTFNSDTKKPIGEFCADCGEVGVFSLKEVLKYNPEFDYHLTKKWTTTLIENFTGDVWDEVENEKVHIVGKGNINFITEQTGL